MNILKIENLQVNAALDRDAMVAIDGGWGIPRIFKKAASRVYKAAKKIIICFPKRRTPSPYPWPRW